MADLNAHAEERLRSEPIIWLTTVRADGRPHTVPVWFLWDGESFLIFSQPEKQKIRNLCQNPNVTLALDDTKQGGDVVVVEGKAELVNDNPQGAALPAYVEKYGTTIKEMGTDPESLAKEYSQAIRVTPVKFMSWSES